MDFNSTHIRAVSKLFGQCTWSGNTKAGFDGSKVRPASRILAASCHCKASAYATPSLQEDSLTHNWLHKHALCLQGKEVPTGMCSGKC